MPNKNDSMLAPREALHRSWMALREGGPANVAKAEQILRESLDSDAATIQVGTQVTTPRGAGIVQWVDGEKFLVHLYSGGWAGPTSQEWFYAGSVSHWPPLGGFPKRSDR